MWKVLHKEKSTNQREGTACRIQNVLVDAILVRVCLESLDKPNEMINLFIFYRKQIDMLEIRLSSLQKEDLRYYPNDF